MKKADYREKYLAILEKYETTDPGVCETIKDLARCKVLAASPMGAYLNGQMGVSYYTAILENCLTEDEQVIVLAEDYRKL